MVAYGNVRSDVVFAGEKHPDHDPDEDESDGEVALDIKGRRHVDTSDRGRDAYWINVKTSSAYTTFPMPGGASSIALRRFLANRLPPELIVDEYGAVTPIDDIRADHLPSLQAQVWRLGPKGHTHTSPRSAYSGFPTRDYEELGQQLVTAMAPAAQQALEKKEALLLATHATFITKLLDGNHIFIIHDGKTSACKLPTCPTPSNDQLSPPTMLAIEPLIHWGTVTAVTEKLTCRALVQAFRRDGKMCSDPLWTLAMKRFTPEHPTTYCENCLELLMDKRIEAWELAKRHETLGFTAVNVRIDLAPRVGHIHVSEEREEVDTGSGTCKGVVRASPEGLGSIIQQFPVRNAGGTDDMAYLQLDGASDLPDTSHRHDVRGSRNGDRIHLKVADTTDIAMQDHQGLSGSDVRSHGPSAVSFTRHHRPFTSSATSIEGNAYSEHIERPAWVTTRPHRSLHPSPSTNEIFFYIDTQPSHVPDHLSFTNHNPNVSEVFKENNQTGAILDVANNHRGTKRAFGREMDANTVANTSKKASDPTSDMKAIRNLFSSTKALFGTGKEGKNDEVQPDSANPSDVPSDVPLDPASGPGLTSPVKTTLEASKTAEENVTATTAGKPLRPRNKPLVEKKSLPASVKSSSSSTLSGDSKLSAEYVPPTSKAKTTPRKTKPPPKKKSPPASVKTPDVLTSTPKSTSFSTTTPVESKISNEHVSPTAEVKTTPRKIKPLPKKKFPASFKTDKPVGKPKDGTEKGLFEPFFAKRPPIDPATIPDTVSEQTYRAYHNRVPEATEIICICRKAARTFEVKLAQCSNKDCVIGWYHYDCLDKRFKLSCRHGTLLCQHCKNETHFKEQDAKNGWSVKKMVEAETAMPFSAKEMLAAMPLPGGAYGVINPYGLGTMMAAPAPAATRPPRAPRPQGALGSLPFFGLQASNPFLMNQAYVKGTAHLHLNTPTKVDENAVAGDGEEEDDDEMEDEEEGVKGEEAWEDDEDAEEEEPAEDMDMV